MPASAQSKKELAAQNAQLAQRLSRLENRMLTGDPAAERLMQRMDAMEGTQRSITGEVERLRYERDTLQEEVRALAANIASLQDLADEMRLHLKAVNVVASQPRQSAAQPYSSSGSTGSVIYGGRSGGGVYQNGSSISSPPTIIGSSPAPVSITSNDVSKLAEIGLEKMQEGDFSSAQTSFKQYLEYNLDAADRGDVYFWLGETYYVKSGFTDAADAYIASMRAAPNGDYAPEAMVRIAATARALGKKDMACQTLASFPREYPSASATVRDKARLESQRSGC